jgi:ribosomal protein L40E
VSENRHCGNPERHDGHNWDEPHIFDVWWCSGVSGRAALQDVQAPPQGSAPNGAWSDERLTSAPLAEVVELFGQLMWRVARGGSQHDEVHRIKSELFRRGCSSWVCSECGTSVTGPWEALRCPKCGRRMRYESQDAEAIIKRAVALWEKSASNYECSAPHDTGSKAACVAARDALRAVLAEVRGLRPQGSAPLEPVCLERCPDGSPGCEAPDCLTVRPQGEAPPSEPYGRATYCVKMHGDRYGVFRNDEAEPLHSFMGLENAELWVSAAQEAAIWGLRGGEAPHEP